MTRGGMTLSTTYCYFFHLNLFGHVLQKSLFWFFAHGESFPLVGH